MKLVAEKKRAIEIGDKVARLRAIGPAFYLPTGSRGLREQYIVVMCECGRIAVVNCNKMRRGTTRSCGCLSREIHADIMRREFFKHGHSRDAIHSVWCAMRQRCTNERHPKYPRYVGRGISVCGEWRDFSSFHAWALLNGYSRGLSIDRIDNDGCYAPNNCRWISRAENTRKMNADRRKVKDVPKERLR